MQLVKGVIYVRPIGVGEFIRAILLNHSKNLWCIVSTLSAERFAELNSDYSSPKFL